MTINAKHTKSETGDYRFLISTYVVGGIVAHAYVRARQKPEKLLEHGADGLMDEVERRGLELSMPAMLSTGICDDAVERILIPLSPALAEYATLTDAERGHCIVWLTPGGSLVCAALMALH